MIAITLGILAAVLQAVGYLVYGFKVLRKDISPNPASWIMFAYGNMLLLVLEWDRGAGLTVLALPFTCTISSVAVAWFCLHKVRRAWWPEHPLERFSFILDVALTVVYVSTWVLLSYGLISEDAKSIATVIILVCWNAGIFTAFFPLLRQVYHHPSTEHAAPWVVWTLAYLTLSVTTLMEEGRVNELLFYPTILAVICAFIGIHTLYWHYRHNLHLPLI